MLFIDNELNKKEIENHKMNENAEKHAITSEDIDVVCGQPSCDST